MESIQLRKAAFMTAMNRLKTLERNASIDNYRVTGADLNAITELLANARC